MGRWWWTAGVGGSEDERSPVSRTGTSRTGLDRATERGRPERTAATHSTSAIRTGPSGAGGPDSHMGPKKKKRGRRTERGSERNWCGRQEGLKATVDVEASAVGRKGAKEEVSWQGCRRQGRDMQTAIRRGTVQETQDGTGRRPRTKKGCPRGRAASAGGQNKKEEQAAHACGVAGQGGRDMRPQGGRTH